VPICLAFSESGKVVKQITTSSLVPFCLSIIANHRIYPPFRQFPVTRDPWPPYESRHD